MRFHQKTNRVAKILCIFAAISAPAFPLRAETEYRTEAGTRIRIFDLHPGNEEAVQFLRDVDRIVSRYLRATDNRKPCEIRIRSAYPPWRMLREDLRDGRITLAVAPDSNLIKLDHAMLARLARALLEARAGRTSEELEPHARFIGTAIAGILRHRREGGRLLRSALRANHVKARIVAGEKIDFAAFLDRPPELPGGPAERAAEEIALIVLEACYRFTTARDNALWDYFVLEAENRGARGERFDATIGRALLAKTGQIPPRFRVKGSPREQINALFRHYAELRLLTALSPRPPEDTLRLAGTFRKIRIPAVKASPKNAARPERNVDISDLPELAAKDELPPEILDKVCAQWNELRNSADAFTAPPLIRFIGLCETLRAEPERVKKAHFEDAWRELREAVKRSADVRRFLEQSEAQNVAPAILHERELGVRGVEPGGSAFKKFLDDAEKNLLAE